MTRRYKFSNVAWEYQITVDENDIVIDCDNKPNGKPHPCVGKKFAWVKRYHQIDAGLDSRFPTKMELIE